MDLETYFRFVVALGLVLALIAGIAWLAKRFGMGQPGRFARSGSGAKRLGLIEILPLDARRRLVLVHRDGAEHLILLGATTEILIESRIVPTPVEPS